MTWLVVFICLTTDLTGVAFLNPPAPPCAFLETLYSGFCAYAFWMIRAEHACITRLHLKGILLGNRRVGRGCCLCAFFDYLVICATKCQMFAFPMRARRWRGWMRGSRTTSDLRFAEVFTAHLTERRYGGIWTLRSRETCRIFGRGTISTPSRRDRSLRATTSGRRTTTHRIFIADRLTGASGPSETWTLPGRAASGMRRGAARGGRVANRRVWARGKDDRCLQVIYLRLLKAVTHFLPSLCSSAAALSNKLCPGFKRRMRS